MWIVELTKPLPVANEYPEGFFPRKFHYKRDALALYSEVVYRFGVKSVKVPRKIVR